MKKDEFFKRQSQLTTAKIKIYKEYIQGYLPKLLMTYESCIIADLFCGAGKNGTNDGSPLVLIDRIKYILSANRLMNKNLNVYVLFNDQDKEFINSLKNEINNIDFNKDVISITIKNEKFENIIDSFFLKLKKNQTPKFIFLDPFTYSNVSMKDLKKIMSLPLIEVLLFIPIFHTYRFASIKFDSNHKTRIFVEQFTSKGIHDYKDVNDFMNSVKEKIINELSLKYVRPVLLDGGGSKNSLFLLTKHQKGMLLMNKVVFNNSDDGNRLKVKNMYQESLFEPEASSLFYNDFKSNLKSLIKQKNITNSEIVDFTIQEGFLPRHAKAELIELHNRGLIKIFNESNREITDKRRWNIAENIYATTILKWL